jgi:uncharacterized membrane protein (TIGR02234 family)
MLAAGAAGAGLVLLAVHQVWARAVYAAPSPLPAQVFTVTGQQLVPLAGALALAALACLAAVIATRGVARRAAGLLLAAIGIGVAVTATASVTAAAVLSAVAGTTPDDAGTGAGSTTSGTSGGGGSIALTTAGHAVFTGWPWHVAAAAGAAVIVLAGLAAAWRGTRWPVMSARFERPDRQSRPPRADSATMWESLSRDQDPTLTAEPAGDAGTSR